jgi:hypothetical protein
VVGLAVCEGDGAEVGVSVGAAVEVGVGCVPELFEPKYVYAPTEPIIRAITTIAIAIEYVAFISFPIVVIENKGNIVTQHRIQTSQ